MTTEEAIVIAIERNGRPHEDDWELAQAAKVLTVALAETQERLGRVTKAAEGVVSLMDEIQDWRLKEESDRVFAWYELEPLDIALNDKSRHAFA